MHTSYHLTTTMANSFKTNYRNRKKMQKRHTHNNAKLNELSEEKRNKINQQTESKTDSNRLSFYRLKIKSSMA